MFKCVQIVDLMHLGEVTERYLPLPSMDTMDIEMGHNKNITYNGIYWDVLCRRPQKRWNSNLLVFYW